MKTHLLYVYVCLHSFQQFSYDKFPSVPVGNEAWEIDTKDVVVLTVVIDVGNTVFCF